MTVCCSVLLQTFVLGYKLQYVHLLVNYALHTVLLRNNVTVHLQLFGIQFASLLCAFCICAVCGFCLYWVQFASLLCLWTCRKYSWHWRLWYVTIQPSVICMLLFSHTVTIVVCHNLPQWYECPCLGRASSVGDVWEHVWPYMYVNPFFYEMW